MKNGSGIFNTDNGLLIYIGQINNTHDYKVVFSSATSNTSYQINKGTKQQCKALMSNIEAKLNPVNVGILHSGETESVERELRDMLGE